METPSAYHVYRPEAPYLVVLRSPEASTGVWSPKPQYSVGQHSPFWRLVPGSQIFISYVVYWVLQVTKSPLGICLGAGIIGDPILCEIYLDYSKVRGTCDLSWYDSILVLHPSAPSRPICQACVVMVWLCHTCAFREYLNLVSLSCANLNKM